MSREEDVKKAVETIVREFGTIDIVLNAAGIVVLGGVDALDVEGWDKACATNLRGPFLTAKYVIPYMKEKNYGKIVNIGLSEH